MVIGQEPHAAERHLVFSSSKLMRRTRGYYAVVSAGTLLVIFYMLRNIKEVGNKVVSKSYENDFHYPLDVDLKPLVAELLEKRVPSLQPINFYHHDLIYNTDQCSILNEIDLIIAVRSPLRNLLQRQAIRKSYGKSGLVLGKVVRTFFFVGIQASDSFNGNVRQLDLERETDVYKDIIQASFIDHYYFNTIKTMTIFRWIYEYCPISKIYLITNDDVYISPANLLRYLSSWEEKVHKPGPQARRLLAGNILPKFQPKRVRGQRWYISQDVYPWDDGPPFPDGGAFVVSTETACVIFAASQFVRAIRYEDVYIGIVAHKIGIPLTHCPQFRFDKKKFTESELGDVIACPAFKKPKLKLMTYFDRTNNFTFKERT